ncbi:hypothetical protein GCM10010987_79930 [Bradyrhizobium guangdongense]|uniref:Uncharacterized protein n=1 Tax=Bradyrhizobium guangdongense TaxID=1325090 RepID=A0AA87WCC3_9BRAD|nr:hypothetical protein GCM10010987_79930 [Bradyrhizobium guangdongense]
MDEELHPSERASHIASDIAHDPRHFVRVCELQRLGRAIAPVVCTIYRTSLAFADWFGASTILHTFLVPTLL